MATAAYSLIYVTVCILVLQRSHRLAETFCLSTAIQVCEGLTTVLKPRLDYKYVTTGITRLLQGNDMLCIVKS